MHNYFGALKSWIKILKNERVIQEDFKLSEDIVFCHKEKVHIFIRGLADGKLHSAKNRYYSDIRFYKKENLKVFCAVCRKRIV